MQNNQIPIDPDMQRRGRKVFLLMLTFFVVPIIVVVLMFKFDWKPNGASTGELIKPPRLLESPIVLKDDMGAALRPTFWKEKWSIVYVAGECQDTCMSKLRDMRQLHVSLYKDIPRTQRVLITQQQDTRDIKAKFPDLVVINQPDNALAALSQQFMVADEPPASANRLYLVDPLGHVMMSYKPTVPLADVRKDVARLLRYSWAG
jgi:cytochrome oxidase Cu insertion factor (SCO1/SenC/PrrC family)